MFQTQKKDILWGIKHSGSAHRLLNDYGYEGSLAWEQIKNYNFSNTVGNQGKDMLLEFRYRSFYRAQNNLETNDAHT